MVNLKAHLNQRQVNGHKKGYLVSNLSPGGVMASIGPCRSNLFKKDYEQNLEKK